MLIIDIHELRKEVDSLLLQAQNSSQNFGAVNWGDLGVVDIEHRQSLLYPASPPTIVVLIEEASPDCELASWLNSQINKDKYPGVWFETEW